MGNQEAFYVTWGSEIQTAVKSRKSLLKHNPDLLATIITPEDVDLQLSNDKFERKVEMIEYYLKRSKTDRVLFLDADTEIFGSVQGIFDALLHSNLAMALAPVAMTNQDVPDAVATYNTGVIGIRQSLSAFIKRWLQTTYLLKDDQHAMRSLLHHMNVKVATLLPRYNFRPRFPVYLSGNPIIIHHHVPHEIEKFSKLGKGLWKG